MINENDLLEPRKAYENILKDELVKNATEYFENLAKEAGVDIEANNETIRLYNQYLDDERIAQNSRKKKKSQKSLLVTLGIIGLVLAIGVFLVFLATKEKFETWQFAVFGIVLPIIVLGLSIFDFVMVGIKISPVIKNQDAIIARLQASADEQKAIGYKQMQSLNNAYTWNMHVDIVNKTVPLFKLDKSFENERLSYLQDSFGYVENTNKNISTVHVQSGTILGNPFLIHTVKVMQMLPYAYHGSLTYTYTVRVRNGGKNGGYHTETRTDTVHATITKPKPNYNYEKFLYYGCDAAPDLSFSREPSGIKGKNENEIKKYVAKQEKELSKLVEKGTSTGFTALGNKQFESLFHSWDRDNEVQYRLLFTPLAQKNYLDLIKNDTPYGDDFYLKKTCKLNKVRTDHSQYVDYVCAPNQFVNFSYRDALQNFVNYNETYFRSFYFDMAVLMSIPLYQQYPTDDYIFNKQLPNKNTMHENEAMANMFDSSNFRPNACATELILKGANAGTDGDADRVNITAYGYKTIEHVDYVPVLGKDGHMHNVPVHWIEYIPVSKVTQIGVLHHALTKTQLDKKVETDSFRNFKIRTGGVIYNKEFYSYIIPQGSEITKQNVDELIKN